MSDLAAHLRAALGDRYRILHELGGGGLSRVFAADELSPPRAVVIKVLPPEFTSAVNSRRFEREIALVAGLQHPHIVPLLATGTANGVAFFTMPFVEGETLGARLADQPRRPIVEVIRLMREVAEALEYARSRYLRGLDSALGYRAWAAICSGTRTWSRCSAPPPYPRIAAAITPGTFPQLPRSSW